VARYFAYGMNMDTAAMAHRCGSPELVCLAQLEGHRFVINRRGVATVVEDNDVVHGVLWELCGEDLDALDVFEGVALGNYRRTTATVVPARGEPQEAIVYVASDPSPGPPRPGYLEAVVDAAMVHGFPEHYVAALRANLRR